VILFFSFQPKHSFPAHFLSLFQPGIPRAAQPSSWTVVSSRIPLLPLVPPSPAEAERETERLPHRFRSLLATTSAALVFCVRSCMPRTLEPSQPRATASLPCQLSLTAPPATALIATRRCRGDRSTSRLDDRVATHTELPIIASLPAFTTSRQTHTVSFGTLANTTAVLGALSTLPVPTSSRHL
jgi:hypothetical protein